MYPKEKIARMAIAKRFKSIRVERKLSQIDFSKKLDTTQSQISCIERGIEGVSTNLLFTLNELYKVDIKWLLFGNHKSINPQPNIVNDVDVATVLMNKRSPNNKFLNILVEQKAVAGYFDGFFLEQGNDLEVLELPFLNDYIEHRTFEVSGDSMYPTFDDGDYVVCAKVTKAEQVRSNSCYVVVNRLDGILLKRLVNDEHRKTYTLVSDNFKKYPPLIRQWSEVNEVWRVIHLITQPADLFEWDMNHLKTDVTKK